MTKNILLINDMPGYGKVALSAMIPVLSYMGHSLCNLPTALVSNTLNYGLFDIMDTTEYMKNTIRVWDELGFHFDAVSTGFVLSPAQADVIGAYIEERKKRDENLFVLVDPIFGDDGVLYNGIEPEAVAHMREICRYGDVVVPNMTEACFLTERHVGELALELSELREVTDSLRKLGAKNVVVTSAVEKATGQHMVYGWNDGIGDYFRLDYDLLPVEMPGTGDVFSAVLLGEMVDGMELVPAVERAMNAVAEIIATMEGEEDLFKGAPIEKIFSEKQRREP